MLRVALGVAAILGSISEIGTLPFTCVVECSARKNIFSSLHSIYPGVRSSSVRYRTDDTV